MQVVLGFFCAQGNGLQGFHKAAEHRQGRADFVRDVGHEIAAHGVGLRNGGDVARQQQRPPFPISVQLHRQFLQVQDRAGAAFNDHLRGMVVLRKIPRKHRVAHQVNNVLQAVPLGVQTQMRRSGVIAPFDAGLLVQQDHAIGRGLNGLQKILQLLLMHSGQFFLLAQHALHAHRNLTPNTMPRRVLAQNWRTQPALKPVQLPQQRGPINEQSKQSPQHSPQGAAQKPAGCSRQAHQKEHFENRKKHASPDFKQRELG